MHGPRKTTLPLVLLAAVVLIAAIIMLVLKQEPEVPQAGGKPAERAKPDRLDTHGQDEWMQEKIAKLKAFKPDGRKADLIIEDGRAGRYRAQGRCPEHDIFMQLVDGQWVYCLFYSAHDKRAQLVLAIDQDGNIYGCNAHVCPSLFLHLDKEPGKMTSAEFFAKPIEASRGVCRWIPVELWNKAVGKKGKPTEQEAK